MPEIDSNVIAKICSRYAVVSMSLFGSVVAGTFTDNSDIDVLVSFEDSESLNYFDTYFSLKEELENYWHRPVDLVVNKEFRNKYFKESLEENRIVIYER